MWCSLLPARATASNIRPPSASCSRKWRSARSIRTSTILALVEGAGVGRKPMPNHKTDAIIRPATEADAATVAAIHVASWRDAYADILTADYLNGPIEADRLALWSQRLRE